MEVEQLRRGNRLNGGASRRTFDSEPSAQFSIMEMLSTVAVKAPQERCFDVTRSIDAHQATSTLIKGRAVAGKTTGLSELGDETTWSARFFGVRFKVRTKVLEMDAPFEYREVRIAGIPRPFGHVYRFTSGAGYTQIEDIFEVGLPFGLIGRAVMWSVLRARLREIQSHRLDSIRRICECDQWKEYLRQ